MSRRGNKEGSIRHRKDGRWEARIFLGYHPDTGKPRQHSKYFRTRRGAQDWLTKSTHERQTGAFVEPNTLTVGEWLNRWLHDYAKTHLRPATWELYQMILRCHLLPAFGKMPLRKIGTGDLQKFYTEKLSGARADGKPGGLSNKYIIRMHTILNMAFDQAVREQKIYRNPADFAKLPPAKSREIKPLTVEGTLRFLEAASKHRLAAAFWLAIGAGLRRGEILALRWQDVDFTAGTLTVRYSLSWSAERSGGGQKKLHLVEPKTESSKGVLPLGNEMVLELAAHKKRQDKERSFVGGAYEDQDLLFCTGYGRPLSPRNFTRTFKAIAAKAGIPSARLHDLRHTFCTRLFELDINFKTIQGLMRHSRFSTTMDIYTHTDLAIKAKAIQLLEEALLAPSKKAG